MRRLEGGLGRTMDVIELVEPDGAARPLVLRRYGPWHAGRGIADREFRALRTAVASGIPVPEPIWLDTESIFAEQAVVISFVDGEPVLEPVAAVIARIHAAPIDSGTRRVLLAVGGLTAERMAEAVPPSRFTGHPLGVQLWGRLTTLFKATRFGESTFVHNDLWPGNLLWRDSQLVAVVDWEVGHRIADACAGSRSRSTRHRYFGRGDIAERFVESYQAKTGRPVDSLPFWTLDALSRPLPDIAAWLPAWQAMGQQDFTVAEVRSRHAALVEKILEETS